MEREEDRTRGCSSPRERVGVLALSIISYTAAGPASRVLIALQASHYPEFRRLISKSAFYRSKFASSRCLWTKMQAREQRKLIINDVYAVNLDQETTILMEENEYSITRSIILTRRRKSCVHLCKTNDLI